MRALRRLLAWLFPARRPQPPTPLPPLVAPSGTGWRVVPGWEPPPDTTEITWRPEPTTTPLEQERPEPKPRNTRWGT